MTAFMIQLVIMEIEKGSRKIYNLANIFQNILL
jgi:hypothetical protein